MLLSAAEAFDQSGAPNAAAKCGSRASALLGSLPVLKISGVTMAHATQLEVKVCPHLLLRLTNCLHPKLILSAHLVSQLNDSP